MYDTVKSQITNSLLIIFFIVFNSTSNAANPNLVNNGSFETDDFTDVIAFPNGFTGPNGTFIGQTYNNNILTGWDFTLNVDGWVEGGAWANAYDGSQYLDIVGNTNVTAGISNILTQVINTEPGVQYNFSFYWGEDVGHAPPEVVSIQTKIIDSANNDLLDETLVLNSVGPIVGVRGPNTWNNFEQTFTATTAQTTIWFTATPPAPDTSAGGVIDLVSVVSTEPQKIPALNRWSIFLLLLLIAVLASYKKSLKQ